MKISFLPQTKLGKCSVKLILGFFVFLGIFWLLVYSGQRGGDTFFSNPVLAIPIIIAAISATASLIIGTISLFKKDFSIAIIISIIIGLFVLIFISGEILTPH